MDTRGTPMWGVWAGVVLTPGRSRGPQRAALQAIAGDVTDMTVKPPAPVGVHAPDVPPHPVVLDAIASERQAVRLRQRTYTMASIA
jgi:hypothetical protein